MNLQDKQEYILAKGREQRGEYDPRPDSVPVKIYNWWRTEGAGSEKRITQENFCHYWRVVLIWAPLQWLAVTIFGFIDAVASPVHDYFANRPNGVVRRSLRATGRGIAKTARAVASPKRFWAFLGKSVVTIIFASMVLFLVYMLFQAILAGEGLMILAVLGVIVLAAVLVVGLLALVDKQIEAYKARKRARRAALEQAWFNNEISDDEYFGTAEKPAGPVKRFFLTIGDFIELVWDIVKVNKWKICPFVNIPEA